MTDKPEVPPVPCCYCGEGNAEHENCKKAVEWWERKRVSSLPQADILTALLAEESLALCRYNATGNHESLEAALDCRIEIKKWQGESLLSKPSTEWIANAAERDILTVVALMRTTPMVLLRLRNRSYQEIQGAISHLIDGQKLVLTAEQYLEIPAIERNVR